MNRKLTISFGGLHQSIVEKVRHLEWKDFCAWLVKEPPELGSKEARGWYCGAEFEPAYRHSDHFVARHVLTFDFDHVDVFTLDEVARHVREYAHAIYTTFSHTPAKPRFRLVLPLSRPAGYDEFQAVSRKIAEQIGIELIARESHVPAQFMYAPCRPVGGEHQQHYNISGKWIDVDETLAQYPDWTDRSTWPHRKDGDGVHKTENVQSPLDKPGIVGEFCRAFSISEAIERFDLPYVPTSAPGRWTYTSGSRPEGAVVYDDDTKLHSHHDTDPARGQHNSFDLVRLHRFSDLDAALPEGTSISDRPSYKAMCAFSREQKEVVVAQQERADKQLEDAGFAAIEGAGSESSAEKDRPSVILARAISDVLNHPSSPRWLIRDELERGVIAVMAGPRGTYKSFIALDWTLRIAVQDIPVYVVSAEGGDYDRRARAWLRTFAPDRDISTIPLYVVERRVDLNTHEGVEAIRQDCIRLNIRPHLFVLDTFSKLSGGLDENDNTAVKQFIGRLDNGLKRKETAFDATVLLVAHTGHSDAGRPRGASALGADTDAEYIVVRNEVSMSVSVTRERFKASPELPPIHYKPEVIDLGYVDAEGAPVTSLVIRAAAAPGTQTLKKPKGANQILMYDAIKELTAEGDTIDSEVAISRACDKVPRDPDTAGRTRMRANFKNALNAMIAGGLVYMHAKNRVSLHPVPAVDNVVWHDFEKKEEWLA